MNQNWVKLEDMEIGADTEKTIGALDEDKQNVKLYDIRKFYQSVSTYLQIKLHLNDTIIRCVQCLHPEVKDQDKARQLLRELCSALPSIEDSIVSKIIDEWKLYRSEQVDESGMYNKDGQLIRIDHYWNVIFSLKNASGEIKYANLKRVVMTCLCISHGNADVESIPSVNKLVTPERCRLSDESVNGLRLTRDAVSMFQHVTDIPITKELLAAVRQAHQKYETRREAERKEEALLERKKKEAALQKQEEKERIEKQQQTQQKLDEKEKDVKKSELELKTRMEKANQIFEEANLRLSEAIKSTNFKEMNISQGLLDVAKANLQKITAAISKCVEDRNDIGKKRLRLINSFMKK